MNKKTIMLLTLIQINLLRAESPSIKDKLASFMPTNFLLSTKVPSIKDKLDKKKQEFDTLRLENEKNEKEFLEKMLLRTDKELQKEPNNEELILKKNNIERRLEFIDENGKLITEINDLSNQLSKEAINHINTCATRGALMGGGLAVTVVAILYALNK